MPYTTQTIKGVEYAVFGAQPGTYQATYFADTTPPVISSVSAAVGTIGTATVQWLTDEPPPPSCDSGPLRAASRRRPRIPCS